MLCPPSSSTSATLAARVVPKLSPAINLGACHLPCWATQVRINCAMEEASSLSPQKSEVLPTPSTWLKPVPIGSINTKSVRSRSACLFSSTRNGAAPSSMPAPESVLTTLGPKNPTCNQTLAEPGPPLKIKSTGLLEGSRTPSRR